jgi:hypothetical protein
MHIYDTRQPFFRVRSVSPILYRVPIRLAVTAVLSREECKRAAGVPKAAVTKVLQVAKRKCAHLLQSSPHHHMFALCYPFTVHMARLLQVPLGRLDISITVNIHVD